GVVLAVGLPRELAMTSMNHALPHRNGVLEHFVSQPDAPQRFNAAHRKSQVDRPAAFGFVLARIGPLLVKIDAMAALAEITRQQRPGQAGADDADVRWLPAGHLTSP